MAKKNWASSKHILCIRPDTIGDIIMLTPALRALKESGTGRRLTLLTSAAGTEIAKFIPEIDEVITFNVPWEKNVGSDNSFFDTVDEIKKRKFDGAIIFTSFSQNPVPSILLAYLADIPLRLSYRRENPFALLTDEIADTEPFSPISHEVVRQLTLVSSIGAKTVNDTLKLEIPETLALEMEEKLRSKGIDITKPFLVLHPGVSDEKRRFSEKYYAQAAKKISNTFQYQILLTGTTSERHLTEQIQKEIGKDAFSLAGELSLGKLIALIGLSDIVITNNTAPAHIAAAMGTPVVDLYARTNPQHTPWKVKQKVLYFDVPEEMQTKNVLLRHIIPKTKHRYPTDEHVYLAAAELLGKAAKRSIPKEVLTWQ